MLTIDKIKEYWISKNTSRVNNLYPAQKSVAIYNDAINVYELVTTVIEDYGTLTGTDLGASQGSTSVTITSSTGSPTTILDATTLRSGVMTATQAEQLSNLVTLSGVVTDTLGTFTGTTIPDNSNIKDALQELETFVEALGGGADGNGIYDGSGTVPTSTVVTVTDTLDINAPNAGGSIRIGDYTAASDGTYGGYTLDLRSDGSASLGRLSGFYPRLSLNTFYSTIMV